MTMRMTGTTLAALLASAGADFEKGQYIPGTNGLPLDQNLFIHSSPWQLFGGSLGGTFDPIIANGSLMAPQIGVAASGAGISDTSFTLGYHFPRVDFPVNFGFIAPACEFHGKKRYTSITPSQTYNLMWGLRQALPLKTKLLQFGVDRYGRWQTSKNGGTQPAPRQDARYKVVALVEGTTSTFEWRDQFSCREMMSLPNSRYCSSAPVPPVSPTALGSKASASAARVQYPGVDRVLLDPGRLNAIPGRRRLRPAVTDEPGRGALDSRCSRFAFAPVEGPGPDPSQQLEADDTHRLERRKIRACTAAGYRWRWRHISG
jgi:hypothetical protein